MRIRWRNLELPSRVAPDHGTATTTYGIFVAEPFERGFGHTIANSLRRILLSSLEGSAVTRAKIARRAARVHDHPRRRRGRHRHLPESQVAGGQEPQHWDRRRIRIDTHASAAW